MVIAIIGVLAAILLPTLAAAKRRANRIKCVSNLKQVGTALTSFADDNSHMMPWFLSGSKLQIHFPKGMGVSTVFGHASIKTSVGTATAKILLSPCDAERKGANDELSDGVGDEYVDARYTQVNPLAMSYGLCDGGDNLKPMTLLALTRNRDVYGGAMDFKGNISSRFVGVDEKSVADNVVVGLKKGQGQMLLSDGSAHQASDADKNKFLVDHQGARGGMKKGAPSTGVSDPYSASGTGVVTVAAKPAPPSLLRWFDASRVWGTIGYVLETEANGVSSYKFVPGALSWDAAKAAAEAAGGHLATIASQAEWDTVCDALWPGAAASQAHHNYVWLGGYQVASATKEDTGWAWVTGEPWNFTLWWQNPGGHPEPNDGWNIGEGGRENCLTLTVP